MADQDLAAAVSFGPYCLDRTQRLLLCNGAVVPLEPKAMDTLVALVDAAGQLVSKEDLLQRVWPDTFVEEGSLARNISTLRRTLGGDAGGQYIETIPKRGYRFVAPLLPVAPLVAAAALPALPARSRRIAPAVVGVLLAVASLLWRARSTVPAAMTLTNPVQVTTATGVEEQPAWSPDGRLLAFAANSSGHPTSARWDIAVVQLSDAVPLNRTARFGGRNLFPSWSPDGSTIAFWSDRDGAGCFVMGALAGAPRKVADASMLDPNPPQWSADGSSLSCVSGVGDALTIDTVSIATGELVRRLPLPGDGRRSYVTQSPDRRFAAYVMSPAGLGADVNQLWLLTAGTGRSRPVTDGWSKVGSVSWAEHGGTLFYVSNAGGGMDLWQQTIAGDGTPAGAARALTAGVMMRNAALNRDGSQLAYSQGRRRANVWRVPILRERAATWRDAEQITADEAHVENLDLSPDGRSLVLDSDRAGTPNLWSLASSGGEMRRLTTGSRFEWGPQWSRDGARIAFFAYRSGNRDVWTMPAGGGPWTQVTTHPGPDLLPAWSPDDSEIAHVAVVDGVSGLWITPASGGPSRLVANAPAMFFDWSRRGDIVFSRDGRLWITSGRGGAVRALPVSDVGRPRWSPDGSRIYAQGISGREGRLFAVAADGTDERVVADFSGRRGVPGPNALATDGAWLYFTWDEDLGDLWTMTVSPSRPH